MKKQFLFTAAALLSAVPFGAQAQLALPVVPVPPPAAETAQAVTLRYKFVPGQTRRYSFLMDMKGLMLTGQSGAGVPLNMTLRMTLRQTVKDVRASDGAATLSAQMEDFHSVVNGQEAAVPEEQQAKMKKPFTIVMLPTGKMLSADMPALGAGGLPGMDFSKGMFNSTAFLPDGPVKVGDIWKGVAASPIAGMQMTIASTLAGLEQKNGATLATVTQKQKGTIASTVSQGMPAPLKMTGTVTGTGTQVFDTTAGAIESATGTTSTAMTITFGKGGAAPAGMPPAMKMQMQANVTMQRLDDLPPPTAL